MSVSDPFNPATDDPQNGAQRAIKETHDRLVEAGHEDAAARLRSPREGTSVKESIAQRLEREAFREPTTAEKAEAALDDPETADLTKAERETVERRLARANTMGAVDEGYAESLREKALALATHCPATARVNALADEELAEVKHLLSRAQTMRSIDPDHAESLREQARGVVEEAVAAELGDDAEEVAVDRDVESTVEAIGGMTPEQVRDGGTGR